MPTTLFSWEPIVECSVARDYLESQPRYSADHQLVNTEAISASHEAQYARGYGKLIKWVYKADSISIRV